MIRDIQVDMLLQLLTAAEQGSFHRAGMKLRVKTSTVSRRVKSLEARIGVKLFERHRHGIRPTDAGVVFLESTRRIVTDLETLLANARTAGRGESGWLRIGLYVSISSGPLRDAIHAYMKQFPGVELRIINESRHRLIERLNSSALDIVIVVGRIYPGPHDVMPLWDEKVIVALPETHRLTDRPTISWNDLRGERILFSTSDPGPELRDYLIVRLNGTGFLPVIIQTPADRDAVVGLVGFRRSITLTYASNAGITHPEVVYREISEPNGSSPLQYFACWHHANAKPPLQWFLNQLREARAIIPARG